MRLLKSKVSKLAAAAVAVAAIGVVGGPYVYIHFINKKAPPPLSFDALDTVVVDSGAPTADPPATDPASTADTAASTTGAFTLAGIWSVAQPSTAGYRVKEVLFGQSTEGVGRTTDVTGSITIDNNAITEGSISVDLTTLKSDQDRRDGQVQNRLLQTGQFPTAMFTVKSPAALPHVPAVGATATLDLAGTLNLHGVEKEVIIPLLVKRTEAGFALTGSTTIAFADYKIEDPSNPAVKTEDHGLLELAMTFAKS